MNKLKVHYVRVSSQSNQNTDRQIGNGDYDLILEDKCSGSIPLFDRPAGSKLKKMIENKEVNILSVHHPDRICRNVLDFLTTLNFFVEHKVNLHFISQGISTLDQNGNEDPTTKLIISMMGVVAEIERKLIRERINEGIQMAKAKGKYLGRKKGSSESTIQFLRKDKSQKIIKYLRKGYKISDIQKITSYSVNTILKVKRANTMIAFYNY